MRLQKDSVGVRELQCITGGQRHGVVSQMHYFGFVIKLMEEDLGSVDLITLIMRGMVPWCLRQQLVSTRPTNWNNGYTSIGDEIHSENHVFLSLVKLSSS